MADVREVTTQAQNKADFQRMYDQMTEPAEQKKLDQAREKKERFENFKRDVGL